VRLAVLACLAVTACLASVASSFADSTGGAGDGTRVASSPRSAAPVHKAALRRDGTAVAPSDAPVAIQRVIAAGNKIAKTPYRYGGGHGSFHDSAYDCSGSVSYALHGGNLLRTPEDSSALAHYGRARSGRWITIYANGGHVWMIVAGLRFDTSGARGSGSRWQRANRSKSGYAVRHPRNY
jgi:hypothetical protein